MVLSRKLNAKSTSSKKCQRFKQIYGSNRACGNPAFQLKECSFTKNIGALQLNATNVWQHCEYSHGHTLLSQRNKLDVSPSHNLQAIIYQSKKQLLKARSSNCSASLVQSLIQ
jgi:hypothetical protein